MTTFKIATWNVNSLRVRLPHVQAWLETVKPDVLALQETKLPNENFPLSEIEALGYHVIYSGQRTYNGVAILSREPADHIVTDLPALDDPQRRVLCATIGGIRILNIYIPNGESVISDKYQYKLNWLNHLDQFLQQEITEHNKMIILGDFNIAPHENDVHDPALWEGKVLFSHAERSAFQKMLTTGFKDCFRIHTPDEKHYSWWDYRMNAFKRNLGVRIDHILSSEAFSNSCTQCYIDKSPRAWERPSDHAPVIAEFKLS